MVHRAGKEAEHRMAWLAVEFVDWHGSNETLLRGETKAGIGQRGGSELTECYRNVMTKVSEMVVSVSPNFASA